MTAATGRAGDSRRIRTSVTPSQAAADGTRAGDVSGARLAPRARGGERAEQGGATWGGDGTTRG